MDVLMRDALFLLTRFSIPIWPYPFPEPAICFQALSCEHTFKLDSAFDPVFLSCASCSAFSLACSLALSFFLSSDSFLNASDTSEARTRLPAMCPSCCCWWWWRSACKGCDFKVFDTRGNAATFWRLSTSLNSLSTWSLRRRDWDDCSFSSFVAFIRSTFSRRSWRCIWDISSSCQPLILTVCGARKVYEVRPAAVGILKYFWLQRSAVVGRAGTGLWSSLDDYSSWMMMILEVRLQRFRLDSRISSWEVETFLIWRTIFASSACLLKRSDSICFCKDFASDFQCWYFHLVRFFHSQVQHDSSFSVPRSPAHYWPRFASVDLLFCFRVVLNCLTALILLNFLAVDVSSELFVDLLSINKFHLGFS